MKWTSAPRPEKIKKNVLFLFLVIFFFVLTDISSAQMQLYPEEGAVFEGDSGQKCLLC